MPEIDLNNKGDLVVFGIPGDKVPRALPIGSDEARKIITLIAERTGKTIPEAIKDIEELGPIEL